MNHIIASFANSFLIVPAKLVGSWPLVLAAAPTTVAAFRTDIGKILGIIISVGFLSSLILWYVGTLQKENNPGASKWCFQAAWMTAIGFPFISLMYYLFVDSTSVISPSY